MNTLRNAYEVAALLVCLVVAVIWDWLVGSGYEPLDDWDDGAQ